MKLDSNAHSVFLLHYHLVLVVKYRRQVFDDDISTLPTALLAFILNDAEEPSVIVKFLVEVVKLPAANTLQGNIIVKATINNITNIIITETIFISSPILILSKKDIVVN